LYLRGTDVAEKVLHGSNDWSVAAEEDDGSIIMSAPPAPPASAALAVAAQVEIESNGYKRFITF
jgi:hypothetical protein